MNCSAIHTPRNANNVVDGLAFRILNLSSSNLWCLFDRLVGRPEVSRAGWRISQCRSSPRPKAKRDAVWTRLHDDEGLSYSEIAHAFQTTRAAVAKAVQRYRQRVDAESVSIPFSA